jgi:hypothetical protein
VVAQVERSTLAGQSSPDINAPGRVTVGLGQPTIPGRRPLLPFVWVGLAVLVIGAGATAMMMRGNGQDANVVKPAAEPAPQAAATPTGAEPSAPTPAPEPAKPGATEPPPPPPPPAQITIRSEPAGAEVYRGNALIGNTPFTLGKPQRSEHLELELRLGGYEPRTFTVTAMTDDELKVTLSKRSSSSHHSSPSRPAPSEPKPAKPAKSKPEHPKHGVDTEVLDPWG